MATKYVALVECREHGKNDITVLEFDSSKEQQAFVEKFRRIEEDVKVGNRTVRKVHRRGAWDYCVQRHEMREVADA